MPGTIKPPCPCCDSNKHVRYGRLNIDKGPARVWFVHGVDGAVAILSEKYLCSNPDCEKVKRYGCPPIGLPARTPARP